MKPIDTTRIRDCASELHAATRWLDQSHQYHPQSGCAQVVAKWRKDAAWLRQQAIRIEKTQTKTTS